MATEITDLYQSAGEWNGRPNYGCALCPYTDLSEARMVDHVLKHASRVVQTERPTDLVLPNGDAATVTETTVLDPELPTTNPTTPPAGETTEDTPDE